MHILRAASVLFLAGISVFAADDPNRATLTDAEKKDGWRLLFDGVSSKGWRTLGGKTFPEKGWEVKAGCLHLNAKSKAGDLTPDESFDNFELKFEWRIPKGANSGVKYRVVEEPNQSFAFGCEYQIIDEAGHKDAQSVKRRTAALYDVFEPKNAAPKSPGEFNESKILVQGNHVEHWLNGTKVVDCEINSEEWKAAVAKSKFAAKADKFAQTPKSHIAIQDHGDEISIRNVKIRTLPAK